MGLSQKEKKLVMRLALHYVLHCPLELGSTVAMCIIRDGVLLPDLGLP